MSQNAARDQNDVPTLLAVSSADGTSPIRVYVNPTTHRLLVDGGITPATADTWDTTGNTHTVTDAAVTASSLVVVTPTDVPNGFWGVVAGSGSFTITSSDSENAGTAFVYKVFA